MKRSLQMAKAGIPSAGTTEKKFKGFRGIGKPKRPWVPGPSKGAINVNPGRRPWSRNTNRNSAPL